MSFGLVRFVLLVSCRLLSQVLSAVSEAGQFEVAFRLVQQMRAAGDTPSKVSFLAIIVVSVLVGNCRVPCL